MNNKLEILEQAVKNLKREIASGDSYARGYEDGYLRGFHDAGGDILDEDCDWQCGLDADWLYHQGTVRRA
jgi:hypothetical protein